MAADAAVGGGCTDRAVSTRSVLVCPPTQGGHRQLTRRGGGIGSGGGGVGCGPETRGEDSVAAIGAEIKMWEFGGWRDRDEDESIHRPPNSCAGRHKAVEGTDLTFPHTWSLVEAAAPVAGSIVVAAPNMPNLPPGSRRNAAEAVKSTG
jgi:hypothetical protein